MLGKAFPIKNAIHCHVSMYVVIISIYLTR